MRATSARERRIIEEMREAFGEHLLKMLLAGYRESESKSSLVLQIETQDAGVPLLHWIELRSEISSGLPDHEEPLVLLALLAGLVRGRKSLGSRIWCPAALVSKVLGWEESIETVKIVQCALDKYFSLSYVRIDALGQSKLRSEGYLVGFYKLITSYEIGIRGANCDTDPARNRCLQIEMRKNLVNDLLRGTLFRINWKSVVSIRKYSTSKRTDTEQASA